MVQQCAYCEEELNEFDFISFGRHVHEACENEFEARMDANQCVRCGDDRDPKRNFWCGDCNAQSPFLNYAA